MSKQLLLSNFQWLVTLDGVIVPTATQCTIVYNKGGGNHAVLTVPPAIRNANYLAYGSVLRVYAGYDKMVHCFTGFFDRFDGEADLIFPDRTARLDNTRLRRVWYDATPESIIFDILLTREINSEKVMSASVVSDFNEAITDSPEAMADVAASIGAMMLGMAVVPSAKSLILYDVDEVEHNKSLYAAAAIEVVKPVYDPKIIASLRAKANDAAKESGHPKDGSSKDWQKWTDELKKITKALADELNKVQRTCVAPPDYVYTHDYLTYAADLPLDAGRLLPGQTSLYRSTTRLLAMTYPVVDAILSSQNLKYGAFVQKPEFTDKKVKAKEELFVIPAATPRRALEIVFEQWKLPWTFGLDAYGNFWVGNQDYLHPSRFMGVLFPEHLLSPVKERLNYRRGGYQRAGSALSKASRYPAVGQVAKVVSLDPLIPRAEPQTAKQRAALDARQTRRSQAIAKKVAAAVQGSVIHVRETTFNVSCLPLPGLWCHDIIGLDSETFVGFGKVKSHQLTLSNTGPSMSDIDLEPMRYDKRSPPDYTPAGG